MDELDLRLLEELQKDGRASIADIARRLRVPRTTLADRLEKLKERGVIRGFKAIVDPEKVGYKFIAFVLVKARRGGLRGGRSNQEVLAEKIAKDCERDPSLPWVEEVHIITDNYDLLIKVWASELSQLTRFLTFYMPSHEDVVETHTLLVLKTPYEASGLRLRPKPSG